MTMHASHPLRIFGVSAVLTVVLGIVVAMFGGLAALWLYVVLTVLEVTFSFDNAVINSRILARMSPLWQMLFLTIGIFIAVFVVRFALPIIIVVSATSLDFIEVVNLALYHPSLYAAELHHAQPIISAFGGTFLLMIGLGYFVDREKDVHWLRNVEKALSRLGSVRFIKVAVMLLVALVVCLTVDPALKEIVLLSSLLGILLQVGLESVSQLFEKRGKKAKNPAHQVGWAAFASFLYLEVLDASFSFDGVIGAFAITTSVLLIVAGLGAGALWVRSLTVYLMRAGTLAKYRYLEHGAYWAILALGLVMLAKLYHLEPPDWVTGTLGLVFIVAAVASSVIEQRSSGTSRKGR